MKAHKKKTFKSVYNDVISCGVVDEQKNFEVASLLAFDSLFGRCELSISRRINIKECNFRTKWYYLSIKQYRDVLYGRSKRKVKSFIQEMYDDYLETDFTVKERKVKR